jgi:hypothetical protein
MDRARLHPPAQVAERLGDGGALGSRCLLLGGGLTPLAPATALSLHADGEHAEHACRERDQDD